MNIFNILVVIGIIVILIVIAGWFTINKFNNDIESGETGRRKHIEEDVQVDKRKADQ
jgi:hypothetical protein